MRGASSDRYGNPFAATGADANGRAAIDWGVYGVPETFLIGRDGRSPTNSSARSRRITLRDIEAGDRKGAGASSSSPLSTRIS